MILQSRLKGSPPVNFFKWYLLLIQFLLIRQRYGQLLPPSKLPIHALEKDVLLDVFSTSGAASESLGWISVQKGYQERSRFVA